MAVERTSLWRRMPVEQYAVDFRRSLARVDRCGRPATLTWAAVALLAVIIGSSGRRRADQRLPEGSPPAVVEPNVWISSAVPGSCPPN